MAGAAQRQCSGGCGRMRAVNRASRTTVVCHDCRRARTSGLTDEQLLEYRREQQRRHQAECRARRRAALGLPEPTPKPTSLGPSRSQWNCEVCDVLVVTQISRAGRFCSRHRYHDKGHRRRARKYGVHYEYINPRTIYTRDNWRCGLCGKRVNKRLSYPHRMSASLDHIVPMSHGGDHAPINVQCAHLKCNMDKGYAGGGEQLALVG